MVEKPNGTSAGSTAFCSEEIRGPGWSLWIDGNGKITAGNGTLDDPKPNAFSLVQIKDCPSATETCKASCYVHGLEKHAPDTHALYQHNSTMIRRILKDDAMSWKSARTVADWISENCAGGFRWHVSGDVFSREYAYWIAEVCAFAPKVPFWIYTRSFEYVPILHLVSTARGGNLAVNLSCDKDNYESAMVASLQFNLRLCYLTQDGNVPDSMTGENVIFPDYRLRGGTPEGQEWFGGLSPHQKSMVCPVDYHGKAENRRCGPCARCLT